MKTCSIIWGMFLFIELHLFSAEWKCVQNLSETQKEFGPTLTIMHSLYVNDAALHRAHSNVFDLVIIKHILHEELVDLIYDELKASYPYFYVGEYANNIACIASKYKINPSFQTDKEYSLEELSPFDILVSNIVADTVLLEEISDLDTPSLAATKPLTYSNPSFFEFELCGTESSPAEKPASEKTYERHGKIKIGGSIDQKGDSEINVTSNYHITNESNSTSVGVKGTIKKNRNGKITKEIGFDLDFEF